MTILVKMIFKVVQWLLIFKRILVQPINNNLQTLLTINFEIRAVKSMPIRGFSCYKSHNVIVKIIYSLKIKMKAVENLLKNLYDKGRTNAKYQSCCTLHKHPAPANSETSSLKNSLTKNDIIEDLYKKQ